MVGPYEYCAAIVNKPVSLRTIRRRLKSKSFMKGAKNKNLTPDYHKIKI